MQSPNITLTGLVSKCRKSGEVTKLETKRQVLKTLDRDMADKFFRGWFYPLTPERIVRSLDAKSADKFFQEILLPPLTAEQRMRHDRDHRALQATRAEN